MLQKSALRCQNTFERIREAYSDIFGYQYRPSALTEAYGYNYSNINQNNPNNQNYKNNQNNQNNQNYNNSKTQKKRTNNSNTTKRNK